MSCVSWSDFAVLSAVLPDFLKNHRNLTQPELVDYTWREEFGYDGAGGRRRYFYNSLNRLERAEVNEGMARILNYEYDGLGRRVGMSSTLLGNTRYGNSGLGLNPMEEVFERGFRLPDDPRGSRNEGRTALKSRESLGRGRYMPYRKNRLTNQERFPQRQTPSMSETRSYVYKGRVPAARSAVGDSELRTLAYGHDALGSIRAVVSHGTVQEQYHYDAFGKPFGDELETDERGYNGKPYDAVLGHYNYGFRDYDPMTGRFATVDPIRDGRNWYVYTTNDPVNFIDPWGLAAEDGSARGTIYNDYVEGLQKFNSFKPAYVLMENVGALGSYSVSGYFKITEDKDSAYTMPITAIGNTEANANNAGDVKIDGQVDIIMNDKVVHTEPLKQPIDPYIISQSSHMIGEASVRLPPQEQAIDFEIELVTALSVSSPNSVATTRRSKTPLRITKK